MKIAVIGSGCAGLGATWLLNEHSEHQVHLFEADQRWGGHVNTVNVPKLDSDSAKDSKEGQTPVDTGFIVFNPTTYPNFLRFCRDVIKVPFIETDMSFSVSRDRGAYEWAGHGLSSFFAQAGNAFDPNQWSLLWDIIRFNAEGVDYLTRTPEGQQEESIQSYLDRNHYSQSFRNNYLLPMTASIWSTPPDTAALDFPILTLLQFLHNHHLLQLTGKPSWLTLKNGSRSYVEKVLEKVAPEQLHLATPVMSVDTFSVKKKSGVNLHLADRVEQFDHVIFACHADTALRLLGSHASEEEQEILSAFEFSKNTATLHRDTNMMPVRRSCWSAWNYLTFTDPQTGNPNVNKVSLTYCMNILQHVSEKLYGPVLVTLNPPSQIDPDSILGEYAYEHPLFSKQSVASQSRLHEIQNKRGLSWGGAWTRYGFHEDGFTSGLKLAEALGAQCPFEVETASRDLKEHQIPGWVKSALHYGEQARRTALGYLSSSSSSNEKADKSA